MNLPLLPPFLCDPVVPSRMLGSKFLLLCFGEDDGQWQRCRTDGHW